MASTGNTVWIADGVYTEHVVINKALVFKAQGTSAVIQAPLGAEAQAILINASGVTLNGLIVDAVNRWRGIDVVASNCTLQDCEVKNCYGNIAGQFGQGVIVSAGIGLSNISILRCHIHHVGGVAGNEEFCHAIYAAAINTTVRGCDIHDISGLAIHWYGDGGGSLLAEQNYIHECGWGIGLYTSNAQVWNNVIRRCVLGIAIRYSILNALVAFNTLLDCSGLALSINAIADGAEIEVLNNVLANSNKALQTEQLVPTTGIARVHHNLRANCTLPDAYIGFTETFTIEHIEASLFEPVTDDGADGIVPTAGNPAIDAGVAMAEVTSDYGGNARSTPPTIGAWE